MTPSPARLAPEEDWPDVEPLPEGLHQGGLLGEEYIPTPARQPMSTAERVARHVARRSDIGELPPPRDPERRARATADVVEFARAYCGSLLDHEPSEELAAYLHDLQHAIEGAGQVHVRMARGAGKTTLCKIALAWALCTGRLHYVVVYCASADLAAGILSDIWDLMETSDALNEDWPEVTVPIRAAEGLSQRWIAQHYHGVRTRVRRSSREICLPTIEGSPASGAIIQARGAGSKTRGLVRGRRRPDLVLLDDLQDRETARNPETVRALEEWIQGDVQGLGGARALNAVMTSTPIEPGDLSDRFADPELHSEWHLVEHPLIIDEPARSDLWASYDALWRAAQLAGDGDAAEATAYYAAHRAEMDEGARVLDPRNYDSRLELSGYQHARNLRLRMGPAAFAAEYQLTTRVREDAVAITPLLVASRVNGAPPLTLPPGTAQVVAFCDVNAGVGISYALLAAGPHQTAAIVGYGRNPSDGSRLVPRNAPDDETDRRIAAALSATLSHLLELRLATADGRSVRVAAVWVDCGYRRRTVLSVCALYRAQTGRLVYGSQGVSHRRYAAGAARHVVQRGRDCDYRQADGEEWYAHDADLWRERAQRAYLAPPLSPGSLSLPGTDPRAHLPYAEELCAEILAEKIHRGRGEPEIYLWTQRPGAGNHYLDATTGALCMAAWYRLLDNVDLLDAAASAAAETAAALRSPLRPPAAPRAPGSRPLAPTPTPPPAPDPATAAVRTVALAPLVHLGLRAPSPIRIYSPRMA